jgi:SAM-dependent MidA family methyltransferase
LDTLAEQSETDSKTHLRQTAAVQTLLSPAEMGELFKVIAFEKGIDIPDYRGFQSGDQSFRL